LLNTPYTMCYIVVYDKLNCVWSANFTHKVRIWKCIVN